MGEDRMEEIQWLLSGLVGFESLSGRPNRDIAGYIAGHLEPLGAEIALDPNPSGERVNVIASIGPRVPGGIVLCGHMDVVPADAAGWSGDPYTLRREGERLIGRGAVDMKGFLACCLAAAPAFAAAPLLRPVHFVFTFDEEIGSFGAAQIAPALARLPPPAAAIVGEPTEMRPISGHRAIIELATEVRGTAGHASEPRGTVSAVAYAARMVAGIADRAAALAADPADTPFDPPWTTISIGRIEGGEARNVVARTCRFDWEIRPLPDADGGGLLQRIAHEIEAPLAVEMQAVDSASGIDTRVVAAPFGLAARPNSAAAALIAQLWTEAPPRVVSFGTDAGYLQAAGIDTVVFGPGSLTQAHQPEESITLGELAEGLAFLDRLRDLLCAPAG